MLENQFNFKESGKILHWVTEMPTKRSWKDSRNSSDRGFWKFRILFIAQTLYGIDIIDYSRPSRPGPYRTFRMKSEAKVTPTSLSNLAEIRCVTTFVTFIISEMYYNLLCLCCTITIIEQLVKISIDVTIELICFTVMTTWNLKELPHVHKS